MCEVRTFFSILYSFSIKCRWQILLQCLMQCLEKSLRNAALNNPSTCWSICFFSLSCYWSSDISLESNVKYHKNYFEQNMDRIKYAIWIKYAIRIYFLFLFFRVIVFWIVIYFCKQIKFTFTSLETTTTKKITVKSATT